MAEGKRNFQIAIDGPVGAGKSTVARLVAEKLGFLYVYTGAMYRALAWLAKEQGIDWGNEEAVAELARRAVFGMEMPTGDEGDDRLVTLVVNGKDISKEILSFEINKGSAIVAEHKQVREILVKKQQEIAGEQSVVMEGRDIGVRVLPEADLKIFMTASEEIRARRQFKQLTQRGEKITYEGVLAELRARDQRDKNRETDPLKIVKGAWVLDTSHLTIAEVVDIITKKVNELRDKD